MVDDRVVLVTGAASGIGRHLVTALVERGARVLATDVDEAGLFAASEEAYWPPALVVRRGLDVISGTQWEEAIAAVLARWGRIDLGLLVAGYLRPGRFHEAEEAEIHRHLDVNTKGVILGARVIAREMVRQRHGHLVAIGSLASLAPVSGLALYTASKFAVRGFCLAIAEELAPHNVAVSVLLPDAVETPMLEQQRDREEAALTFSGLRSLTVEDIERALFEHVLVDRPLEVSLPTYRGALAKAAGVLPDTARRITPLLRAFGRYRQRQR